MELIEEYEIIFPYNKDHHENCPRCVNEETDPEHDPIMVRRSTDLYQCQQCGLLILAGYDRFRLGKRIVLGTANEEYTDEIDPEQKVKTEKK